MENKIIAENLKKFIKESLKILRKNKNRLTYNEEIYWEPEPKGNGSWKGKYILNPRFNDLINKLGEQIFSKQNIKNIPYPYNKVNQLQYFLIEYMKRSREIKFKVKIFNKLSNEYINSIKSNSYVVKKIIPLYNFKFEGDRLQLDKERIIREFTLDELNEILPASPRAEETLDIMRLNNCIETEHEYIEGKVADGIEEDRKFLEILDALRIFKEGDIGINETITKPKTFRHSFPFTYSSSYGKKVNRFSPPYKLSKKEGKDFVQFWKLFKAKNYYRKGGLDISIKRLGDCQLKKEYSDRLLDLMIGYEALFLHQKGLKKDKGELRYRLSLRAAYYLAPDNPTDRWKIFNEIREAYDLRSNIVHGGVHSDNDQIKVNKESISFKEFVVRIENHFRNSIKNVILDGKYPDFDKLIMGEK